MACDSDKMTNKAQRKIYSQPMRRGPEQLRMLFRLDLNLTHFNLIGFFSTRQNGSSATSKVRKIGI